MRPLSEIIGTLQYHVDRLEEAGNNKEEVDTMNQALEELREHNGALEEISSKFQQAISSLERFSTAARIARENEADEKHGLDWGGDDG